MTKNRLLLAGMAFVFAALGFFWNNKQNAPHTSQAAAVNHLLDQSLPDANGKMHSLAQWKNKTLIVNFWATWCPPCVEEMPELSALQTELAPAKIQIIGIGIDSAANIAEFAAKYKIDYPLYVGGMAAGELSRQLGNPGGGLPFTLLINADGQVRKSYLGRLKINELRNDIKAM